MLTMWAYMESKRPPENMPEMQYIILVSERAFQLWRDRSEIIGHQETAAS